VSASSSIRTRCSVCLNSHHHRHFVVVPLFHTFNLLMINECREFYGFALLSELLLISLNEGQICDSCRRPSVVRPSVISQKLSNIGPSLLWNTVRKLAPLILLRHSDPLPRHPPPGKYLGFKYKICSNISTASCSTSRQSTAVVNRVRLVSPRVYQLL